MSLYKVYQTEVIDYALQTQDNFTGACYHEEICSGNYLESLVRGVGKVMAIWGAKGGFGEMVISPSIVYALCMMQTAYHPGWEPRTYAFNGTTGQLMWFEEGNNAFNLIDNIFQDTDKRIWAHSVIGASWRYLTSKKDVKGVIHALPDYDNNDLYIADSEWLESDGSPIPAGSKRVLSILPREDAAIIGRGNETFLYVHSFGTKRVVHKIAVSYGVEKGVAIDDHTFYAVSTNGIINVIDYKRGEHLGFMSLGRQYIGGSRWITVGFDPVYRRMLTWVPTPDGDNGEGTTLIEGFKLYSVPVYLVKPIPLAVPRVGRTVPIYSRVVNSVSGGVAGIEVTSDLVGGNSISPSSDITDATGKVDFWLDCDVSGVDVDTVYLEAEYSKGVSPPAVDPEISLPPSNISDASLFHPGWWLYSVLSDATPSAKWDAFLDGYESQEEQPVKGVLQEYKWTDFEDSTLGVYNFSKLEDDLGYLAIKGYKLMISVVLTSESDADVWVPGYIVNDTTGAYSQAKDSASQQVGKGVFHLTHVNASGEGWAPIIWDDNVNARVRALLFAIVNAYGSNSDVVGIAIGDCRYSYDDFYEADVPGVLGYLEERLNLLNYVDNLTLKPIWEFGHRGQSAHLANAEGTGINIAADDWFMDIYNMPSENPETWVPYVTIIPQGHEVAAGIVVGQGAWTRDENKLCTDGTPQATAYQMSFGDADVTNCSMRSMDSLKPYFVFWHPDAVNWPGTEGIKEVCQSYLLSRVSSYLGT